MKLNKILIFLFMLVVMTIGSVSAADDIDFIQYDNYGNDNVSSLDYQNEPLEIGEGSVSETGKVIKFTESDFDEYFDDDGYVRTDKVSPYDVFDLSGNFSNIEVMIFTIPVTVTSSNGDAYLQQCTIQFDKVIASESKMAKVSNLRINNTKYSGFNGILTTYSAYIEITNNTIYSESAGGNPIRLLASNYTKVTNNVLETYFISLETGFNASWTRSTLLLGESHYNYIANNYLTVKESNPIYLSSYGCGPSNYNVIFNNTIKSTSKSQKTGLSNPSSWTYGIQMMGSFNKAINNTIHNVYRGISADACGGPGFNEIIGNVIFNITGGYYEGNDGTEGGEYAIVGTLNSLIADNVIYDSKFGGRESRAAIVLSAGCIVYGNKIAVSDQTGGIMVFSNSDNVKIYENIINTKDGAGIYLVGYMDNLTLAGNVITSENGNGIKIKKLSTLVYPTNVNILSNHIFTGNKVFIEYSEVPTTSFTCKNNVYDSAIIVTNDNFFNYFDKDGNLNCNAGILVFRGSFDGHKLNIANVNINRPVVILGNDAIVKDIQFNIASNDVVVENVEFETNVNSAIAVTDAANVSLVRNIIQSTSANPAVVLSNSNVCLLSNNIKSDNLAILAKSGSKVTANNNLINVSCDYTIDLTDCGESVKNNITYNYLIGNLKGDASVNSINDDAIYENDGLCSKVIIGDTVSFVNYYPMLKIYLHDWEGNPIKNELIVISVKDSKNQTKEYSIFTDRYGIVLLNEYLPVGNYTFSAVYNGNSVYKSSEVQNRKLNVVYMDTSISADNIDTYYGFPVVISVDLKGNGTILLDGKVVSLKINGKTFTNTTVNGVAVFNIGILPKGSYTVEYAFEGDENCIKSNGSSSVNVKMMPTTISSGNVVMFYNDGSGVTAYLKNNRGVGIAGKTVSIVINGKTYKRTTDKNGKVFVAVTFAPKTYTVSLKFAGDSNHVSSKKTVKVQVQTRTSKIVASNVVKYYGDSKKLVVYLKDTKNKPIAGKSLTIKVNGKTYKRTTDKTGKVSLSVNLKKSCSANIKFSSTYHKSSSKTIKVSVVTPKISAVNKNVKKGKKLSIVFKTYNGKVIGGQKVFFVFKGKTFNLNTDSKGIATLTCNIKKGSYSVLAGLKSTSTYGTSKTTVKFKVV